MILRHPAFYANLSAPDMVKPPIVFVAAGLRMGRRFVTENSWSWLLEGMGQVPFYPPNVSGWKQGPAFLNTNTARGLLEGVQLPALPDGQRPRHADRRAGGDQRAIGAVPAVGVGGQPRQARAYAQDYATRNGPTLDRTTASSARR